MKRVLIAMEAVKWMAKDVHYRSNDEWFYALHLLADKIDFGSAEDDIKEAYYLGETESLPPTEKEIAEGAAKIAEDVRTLSNRELVERMKSACEDALYAIEEVKRIPGLFAGTHAILDGVSQNLLVVKGLCWRTLENGERRD